MKTPLFSGHSASYHNGTIVREKLKTIYVHPSTNAEYKLTVSYRYNDSVPDAIENHLLHSPEYANWREKTKKLVELYSPFLQRTTDPLWPTVTGLEIFTKEHGKIQWAMFEDIDEIVEWIPASEIPLEIMRVDAFDIVDEEYLMGYVYRIDLKGRAYVMKAHESPSQNELYPTEVKAMLKFRNAPHVVQLAGVVVEESQRDRKEYVRAILLPYCEKGDLKTLLQNTDPPVSLSQKTLWATQIAHGIMGIYQAGLMHGDLKCSNVVIDRYENAFFIDIINGEGSTEGWCSIWDERKDSRREVYGLGVTVWELIHDGADPTDQVLPLLVRQDASEDIKSLIARCVVDEADQWMSLADAYTMLGGCHVCGCVE